MSTATGVGSRCVEQTIRLVEARQFFEANGEGCLPKRSTGIASYLAGRQ